MSLVPVEWACDWPLALPYFEESVPAGFLPRPTITWKRGLIFPGV